MSGTRSLIKNKKIISDGVMTGTTVITSDEMDTTAAKMVSLQMKWTGAAVGTFVVQIPESFSADGITVATWATLPVTNSSGSALTAAGSASSHQVDITVVCFNRLRVQYTNSSSTGTLQTWATAKGE